MTGMDLRALHAALVALSSSVVCTTHFKALFVVVICSGRWLIASYGF